MKFYENSSHIFHWGETNLSIARTFIDLKNYEQAKIYIEKTLALARLHNEKRLLAEVFREKSYLLQETNQYDSALYYSHEGIKLYEERHDTLDVSILYGRLSRIYLIKKEYAKSHEVNKKTILMDKFAGNDRGLSIAYGIHAEVLYALNKKDSAIYFLNKSLEIEKHLHNLPNIIRDHQLLAKVYEDKQNTKAVIKNLKLANQLKDSLNVQKGSSQIQEILTSYELENKEKIIQLLESEKKLQRQKSQNQNLIIGIFGVAIILISLLAILFWRLRETQSRANKELALRNQDIALQNEEIQSQAESLQEISELKSKLLSVVSHDLRGPIASVQSLMELLSKQLITPEEFRELSAKLKSNLNVTQRTLQNLLNWSLSQMEGIKTEPISFNIDQTIREAIDLNYEAADKKQIKIHFHPQESFTVKADVDQVNLILRNLTHNAVKFSKSNGIVKIKTERENGHCKVSVEDQGIGMTDAEVNILLSENEFFTRAGTHQEKGTGLGLLLCKDFIRRNGGTLSIDSKVDSGTQVVFTLPLA